MKPAGFDTPREEQRGYSTSGLGGNWSAWATRTKPSSKRSPQHRLNFYGRSFKITPASTCPKSGRSQPSILAVANHFIDWVMTSHPDPNVRTALSVPHIVPVPEDDPQQNPPDDPDGIKFISANVIRPMKELEAVVKSMKGYLDSFWSVPDEEKPTIAMLVPRNARGIDVVNALRQKGIEPIELISSHTSETRAAAGSLSYLLGYLADPQSARKLSKAYEVWRRDIAAGLARGTFERRRRVKWVARYAPRRNAAGLLDHRLNGSQAFYERWLMWKISSRREKDNDWLAGYR
jgi:hypothetical protein